ncbi:MAG: AMP-binding protein [Deltaproteobacteria bacterium]|nr:AMP-binding protein [Deltaproteobacteria bacterium]
MKNLLDGCVAYRKEDAERYDRLRWWPGLTLGDLLDKAADIYPDREAFVDGKGRLTFSEARDNVNRLALALMDMGIKPLDRVLVQVPNCNEFLYAYFALQKVGAIVVLLIDRYRQHEINHLIRLTDAVGWFVPEKYRNTDFIPIIGEVIKDNPQLKHVILVRGGEHDGLSNMERLIERASLTPDSLARLSARRPDPMQVAHMGPTGGTTGLPKVVPRTHNSLVCSSEYAARAWEYGPEDICLLAGPIGHDLTFTKGLISGIFTFAKIVFLDNLDMEAVCKTIEREKITAVVWVPTLASRLLHYENLGNFDLSSLRKMHCGGGASLPDLIKGIRERLGCTYYNAYGGTEGQTTITRSNDDLETVCNTVGRPTCPYDIYKVVDRAGKELPPDTPGELVIKGPGVFTGYFRNPEENNRVFDEHGFFRTGDVAKINRAGYVTLTGRIKEMINRGGESISATEIERLIIEHPDVINVAVIPMPDPDLGERVCAYIQPRQGSELTFETIIDFLRSRNASVLQLPERIEFIETMPFTKAEKMDKTALRQDIEKKLRPPL